jgi:hypothetical protein
MNGFKAYTFLLNKMKKTSWISTTTTQQSLVLGDKDKDVDLSYCDDSDNYIWGIFFTRYR